MTAEVSESARPPVRSGRGMPGWARAMLAVGATLAIISMTSYATGLSVLTSSGTIQSMVRLALPIVFAGLGGLWAERAGVINIGLEGMMILGTWGGAWAGWHWGPWAGLAAAACFGALGGLLHAVVTVTFGVNHIVSGVVINLLAVGVTKYLTSVVFEPVSGTPRESPPVRKFDEFAVQPLGDWLGTVEAWQRVGISDVAGILRGLVTGCSPPVVLAVLLIPITYWLLWRTSFGLRLRACGENPYAVHSVGVSVPRYRYAGVVVSGLLAGLGGACLVLNQGQPGYLEGQTGGRGFIGLAAMIFGNWRPGGLLGGSVLFGYTDALRLREGGQALHGLLYGVFLLLIVVTLIQLVRRNRRYALGAVLAACGVYAIYWFTDELPRQLAASAPHLVTLIVLAVAANRLRPPAAAGLDYRPPT